MNKLKSKELLKKVKYLLIGLAVFVFYLLFVELLINNAVNTAVIKDPARLEKKEFDFLTSLEDKNTDLFMFFKSVINKLNSNIQYEQVYNNKNVSNDIMIIAIDDKSLFEIGKFPFKRSVHASISDYFRKSESRENSLFFDIFFIEPDYSNPENDFVFIDSMKKNGNVVLDYPARLLSSSDSENNEMEARINVSLEKFGGIKKVFGKSKFVETFNTYSMPLIPYMESVSAIGTANAKEDSDKIVRKYPLLTRYLSRDKNKFSDLKPDLYYDVINLINYKVSTEDEKSYNLINFEEIVFEQDDIDFVKREKMSQSDIDKIKNKIDKINSDFMTELITVKNKYEKSNENLINKTKVYLSKSKLPDDFKKQISDALNQQDSIKNADMVIFSIIESLTEAVQTDKKLNSDLQYFRDLYKDCIKLDNEGPEKIINGVQKKITLYDFVYNNGKMYFDELYCLKEKYLPSAPLVLALRYFNIKLDDIEVILGKEIRLYNPKLYNPKTNMLEKPQFIGKSDYLSIPIDNRGLMKINYAGKASNTNIASTYKVYSYSDFVTGKKQVYLKNKIALVGAFANGMADDQYQTPFQTMYGIEMIANALNTVIMNNFINYFPPIFYYLILLIMCLLVARISGIENIFRSYIYVILLLVAYFLIAALLFVFLSFHFDVVKVIIIGILSLTTVIVYRVLTEQKDKKKIKNIFSKFVNSSVVELLIRHPPELGGIDMDITVQFSDIRGFTTLSEALTPQELVKVLNKYLTAMTDIILANSGTLDKYIGDAIMCFWGAPHPLENNAELACSAALKQMERLREINTELPEDRRLNIGIGLNTGVMTSGYMGSEGRMNYTIMGDNVNLGSRLEGINKYYGTNIIVSESTYSKTKDKFIYRELDNIKVKGKNKPVKIYELLGEISELKLLEG